IDETLGPNRAAGPRFQGGGIVALGRADNPLLFADPTALSFGLLPRAHATTQTIALTDAGGGAGTWRVTPELRTSTKGVELGLLGSVSVPGNLAMSVTVGAKATAGDLDGYLELRHGTDVRRVPFWGRVTAAGLARHATLELTGPGVYRSTTAGQPSFVSRYR